MKCGGEVKGQGQEKPELLGKVLVSRVTPHQILSLRAFSFFATTVRRAG